MSDPSAPSPSAARSPRRARLSFIGAALIVLLTTVWYFRPRGPFAKTQNGITFLGTKRTAEQGSVEGGLTFAGYFADFAITSKTKTTGALQFSARSSTGDTFALSQGNPDKNLDDPFEFFRGRTSVYHVDLPINGFPANYEWVELIARDASGVRGVWRLQDFPKLQPGLSRDTPLHEAQTVQNIPVRARAWWDPVLDPAFYNIATPWSVVMEAKADVSPSVLSRPSEVWGLQIKSRTMEWERPPASNRHSFSPDFQTNKDARPFVGPGVSYATTSSSDSPTPDAQHVAQIKADLTQYDAVMETVTFHNLPLAPFRKIGRKIQVPAKGLSMTTPSGVIVTLRDASEMPRDFKAGDLVIECRLTSTATFRPLRSPLNPTANEPPLIVCNVVAEKNGFASAQNHYYPGDPHEFLNALDLVSVRGAKTPTPTVLPQLTVTIAHQTQMQRFPLKFTLPVRKGTPKEKWKMD